MEVQVESRGKVSASTDSMTLYSGELTHLKLRQRGVRNLKCPERYGLLLRPLDSQICYVLGLHFMQ